MSGDTGGGRPGPKESPKRQRPLKRARVGWPSALRKLKELLYEMYLAAGGPSLDEITGDIADDGLAGSPSRDTVHRVISDGERPGQQADVVAVATVLARRAAWDAHCRPRTADRPALHNARHDAHRDSQPHQAPPRPRRPQRPALHRRRRHLIHTTSRGSPRAVNNLCLLSLVATFAAGKSLVDDKAAQSTVTEVLD
ncbi:hypothetical protein [Streptomyces sp. NPDC059861]|uniref:hypothetical protein n=1 Tax=Streptomyces sp. NPDC059861 TaxID=3346974 RepID=UPI0036570DB0